MQTTEFQWNLLMSLFLLLHWVPLRTLFSSLLTYPDQKVSFRAAQSNISTCVFYQAECSAALKNSSIKNSFSLALKGKNDGMLMWWRSRSVLGTVGFLMEKLFHGLNSWNVPGRAQAVSCARFVFLAPCRSTTVEGDGGAVNLESWSGMLLVSEHASSSSDVRPL